MKYFIVFFGSLFSFASLVNAQQNHFVYLQADNKQPFYIKFDNKILSSSSAGYLILSKLVEGNYKLLIGFPKSEWHEQTININVDKKDQGFLLKNFGEKGWGIFNLETNEVLMAGNTEVNTENKTQTTSDDPFSTMLANVINDSTLLKKDVVKDVVQNNSPEIKPETKENIKKEEPKEVIPDIVKVDTPAIIPISSTDVALSIVKRTFRKKNKEGTELVYVDEYDNKKDTIRIFIPVEKEERKDSVKTKDVAINDAPVSQPVSDSVKSEDKPVGSTAIKETKEDDKPQPKEYRFIEDKKDKLPVVKSTMINSDCKAVANDEDFLKLRKKMAAETTDENMIKVAKKAFKLKCYSTELIKNLSALFLNDEGKYMFFDAAYPFVSDSDLFSSLKSQLSDSYYVNRFNAMVHK